MVSTALQSSSDLITGVTTGRLSPLADDAASADLIAVVIKQYCQPYRALGTLYLVGRIDGSVFHRGFQALMFAALSLNSVGVSEAA